jgi:hypothetical protein
LVAEDAEIGWAGTVPADGPHRGERQRDEERATAYELPPIHHRN